MIKTTGVVTSTRTVMLGMFSIFAILPILDMKEADVGLAAAGLIDATIVRAPRDQPRVGVPSTRACLPARAFFRRESRYSLEANPSPSSTLPARA